MATQNPMNETHKFSDLALQRIDAFDLPRSPEIYELWYVYFAQANGDVVKSIDALIEGAEEGKLSESECLHIYNRFLSTDSHEKAVEQAGTRIERTIADVNLAVNAAKKSAVEYSANLKGATDDLRETSSLDQLGDMLTKLLSDTDAMINNSDLLHEVLGLSMQTIDGMRRDLETARKEAITDSLTGLSNRKAFDRRIEALVAEAEEDSDHHFCLILMDIDHFKGFNDQFGHQVGDQVLKLVARTLKDGVKGRDLAVRYGGEEFAILLPDTGLDGGKSVAEILRKEVEKKEVINRATGKRIAKITLSAGVSQYRTGESAQELVSRVDEALYAAKDAGRNQVIAVSVK